LPNDLGEEKTLGVLTGIWERVADQLMHYATPGLFMIDWLAFLPKGSVPWTMIGTSLVTPILYGIWTVVHGALTNWYPYPFFDAAKLGHQKTSVNMTIFVGVFIGVALTLVVIDRIMGSLQGHDASEADEIHEEENDQRSDTDRNDEIDEIAADEKQARGEVVAPEAVDVRCPDVEDRECSPVSNLCRSEIFVV